MTKQPRHDTGTVEDAGYSVRVVSRLTGVTADTLRMWERRYGFPNPVRSESGVRKYTRADVERLTLVVRSLKLGYRVGETIRLDETQLRERLSQSDSSRLSRGHVQPVQDLVDCIIADGPDDFRDKLRQSAANLGTKRFIVDVAAPLLHDIGEAWSEGILEVQQEHLATEILISQIHAISAQYENTAGPILVLATLPRESHSLGLQLIGLYAAASGARTRILGPDVPPAQIALAAKSLHADAVGVSISTAAALPAVRDQLAVLVEKLDSDIALWLGGKGALRLDAPPSRAICLNHWDEIDDALTNVITRVTAP